MLDFSTYEAQFEINVFLLLFLQLFVKLKHNSSFYPLNFSCQPFSFGEFVLTEIRRKKPNKFVYTDWIAIHSDSQDSLYALLIWCVCLCVSYHQHGVKRLEIIFDWSGCAIAVM